MGCDARAERHPPTLTENQLQLSNKTRRWPVCPHDAGSRPTNRRRCSQHARTDALQASDLSTKIAQGPLASRRRLLKERRCRSASACMQSRCGRSPTIPPSMRSASNDVPRTVSVGERPLRNCEHTRQSLPWLPAWPQRLLPLAAATPESRHTTPTHPYATTRSARLPQRTIPLQGTPILTSHSALAIGATYSSRRVETRG